MKTFALLSLLFSCVTASIPEWEAFKLKFNRVYSSDEEELHRFEIFKSNLQIAEQLGSNDPFATYGVTKFSDLTPEEFHHSYLMDVVPEEEGETAVFTSPTALPASFDWSAKGALTPVKNQGSCGSCWAFAAVATIESVCKIAGYSLTAFSEQQVVDCDKTNSGCKGGWPHRAFDYVKTKGIQSSASYPYKGVDGSCKFNATAISKCHVKSWKYVTQNKDESAMQNFLYNNSPMSVCVSASTWQHYTGGVITSCPTTINHCVQATGWNIVNGRKVWTIRNSWGRNWGVAGHIYLDFGRNMCAVAQSVTVPCVTATNGRLVC